MRLASRLRLIPLLILVSLMSFAVRMGEVMTGFSDLSGAAFAVESGRGEGAQADEPETQASAQEAAEEEAIDAAEEGEVIDWQDAGDGAMELSGVTMELFEDLSARRQELDAREQQLIAREALMQAAEQELDQKYRELQILKGQLESLLKEQSEEEEARIQSLVKIYEGMKSGDAARIFNTLDIDILVQVMSRMSERKLSPILADMSPERARAVTIILAQQKQLPSLP
jgi:flagellar motility protein MotE (MotC chaperone)